MNLSAGLNRVRQQVSQLLHGHRGEEPEGPHGEPRERGLLPEVVARVTAIEARLPGRRAAGGYRTGHWRPEPAD